MLNTQSSSSASSSSSSATSQKSKPGFVERHEEIVSRAPKHPTFKLWRHALLFSAAVTFVCGIYLMFYFKTFHQRALNEMWADAGFLLIGCSFALSGVCYFWNFLDTKIIYRKYIGLIGFYFVALHVLMSLFFLGIPFSSYLKPSRITAFLAACFSLAILMGMAAISNRYAVTRLGGVRWRKLLRLGYAAYFFGLIHFALRKGAEWDRWLAHPASLPPLSMIVVVLGIAVLVLRFLLYISLSRKQLSSTHK